MEDGTPVLPMLYNALALTPPPVFPSDIFLQLSTIVNVYSARFPSDCIIKARFPLLEPTKSPAANAEPLAIQFLPYLPLAAAYCGLGDICFPFVPDAHINPWLSLGPVPLYIHIFPSS